jgi:hypothetical protein
MPARPRRPDLISLCASGAAAPLPPIVKLWIYRTLRLGAPTCPQESVA